ncbi:hypothetical protein B0T25DRAFT_628299 [Lasiosphaeria hispida]|uniref:Uncharacterized protein n=1 Tax=Lasiosphaeria hispida TaxID=260671 RepID=A0AAJ0HP07_9PEZI|nr:hypothetical protein B0T25DRAFT_628299 [Lasiosphaeria hispida]
MKAFATLTALVAIAAAAPMANTDSAASPKAARYFEYYSVPAGADGEAVKAAKGGFATYPADWKAANSCLVEKRDFLFYPVPSGADGKAVQAAKVVPEGDTECTDSEYRKCLLPLSPLPPQVCFQVDSFKTVCCMQVSSSKHITTEIDVGPAPPYAPHHYLTCLGNIQTP